jgi:hypothetical protein
VFEESVISTGYGITNREQLIWMAMALWIFLVNQYNWETPRIDVWLNNPDKFDLDHWQRHVIDPDKPWRAVLLLGRSEWGPAIDICKRVGCGIKIPVTRWNMATKDHGTPLNITLLGLICDHDGDEDILAQRNWF